MDGDGDDEDDGPGWPPGFFCFMLAKCAVSICKKIITLAFCALCENLTELM